VSVQNTLETVFREVFANPGLEIHDQMSAQDVAEWDSLNHVILIVEVEKAFKKRFSTAEVSRLQNVGDLRRLIESKLSEA
jgi:acyl carrier protein